MRKPCSYARQDTAARQAAVDAVRNGGLDLNGNPPVVSSLVDGELAHALRVQAVWNCATAMSRARSPPPSRRC